MLPALKPARELAVALSFAASFGCHRKMQKSAPLRANALGLLAPAARPARHPGSRASARRACKKLRKPAGSHSPKQSKAAIAILKWLPAPKHSRAAPCSNPGRPTRLSKPELGAGSPQNQKRHPPSMKQKPPGCLTVSRSTALQCARSSLCWQIGRAHV